MSDNVIHAISGALGGAASMAITYPLITLSTRAQVNVKSQHVSAVEAIKRTLDKDGIQGLYSGLSSALFGITLTNGLGTRAFKINLMKNKGIYYYWYEWTKSGFERAAAVNTPLKKKALTTTESMIAGLIAGEFATVNV